MLAQPTDDGAPVAAAASGSTFFWAMRLLPAERRDAMFAIYAFCREVDDIADGDAPHAARLEALADWRRAIAALYRGAPDRPVARALTGPVRRFGLRQDDFLGVIEGMEREAREDIRAPPMAALDHYCDRVASAVGRLSVRIFGLDDAQGLPLAHSLGRALQLTNILRDLGEDAERGRLYLPAELLARHGIDADRPDPAAVLGHPHLPEACRDLADLALGHFAEAGRWLRLCPRHAVRPAAVMNAVYRRLLERLIADAWQDPARRVRVPTASKLWLAVRHGLL
jgi:phytoene synthase